MGMDATLKLTLTRTAVYGRGGGRQTIKVVRVVGQRPNGSLVVKDDRGMVATLTSDRSRLWNERAAWDVDSIEG